MFKLEISDDEGKKTVVPLVRDSITVGRKEGNTIRLTERNVSRRHARLTKTDDGFQVEDLESFTGVFINDARIENSAVLTAGDQIRIGDYMLKLQLDAPDSVAPAPNTAEPAPDPGYRSAAPPPGKPARLVMLTPPAPGAEFALSRASTRLGRSEDLDVWVNHRSISREHVEVTRAGDTITITDLGSANGTRVNGEDITDATLKTGDVVEVGEVRFRFVPAGENYHFEADRTIQVSAVPLELETKSKTPLIIAAAILGLALVGALVMFALGGEDEEPVATPVHGNGTQVTNVDPQPTPAEETPTPMVEPTVQRANLNYDTRMAKAQDEITREAWSGALQTLRALHADFPDDPVVSEKLQLVEGHVKDGRDIAMLTRQASQRQWDQVHDVWHQMSRTAKDNESVRAHMCNYARYFSEGASGPGRIVSLRAIHDLGEGYLPSECSRLYNEAAEAVRRHNRNRRGMRPAMVSETFLDNPYGPGAAGMASPAMTTAMMSSAMGGEAWRHCARGDDACFLSTIGRNPRSKKEHELVILSLGQSDRDLRLRLMRRYVQRWPSGSHAARWQRQLEQLEQ